MIFLVDIDPVSLNFGSKLWATEKIQGELLKLGIKLSKRTIQKYLQKARKQPSQAWLTFLKNHAHEIWV